MATLVDIGREAGCSAATVSRALRGDRRISEATRERIVDIARTVGYRPDLVAALRGVRKQKLVGLVIPNIGNSQYHYDTSLLHDALSSENCRIVLCCHYNEADADAAILRNLVRDGVDGIIHIPCTSSGVEGVLGTAPGIPIVELGFRSSSRFVDAVYSDERLGLTELVRYLVDLGHRQIAMVTGRRELHHVRERVAVYSAVLHSMGLSPKDCPVLNGPANAQAVRQQTLELVDRDPPPTAIIAANGPATIGLLRGLRERGMTIPEDMTVVGLSDEPWFAVTDPPLTSYTLPLEEEGVMAAQLLLRRLRPNEEAEIEPRIVNFSGHLEIRESAGAPRTRVCGGDYRLTVARRHY